MSTKIKPLTEKELIKQWRISLQKIADADGFPNMDANAKGALELKHKPFKLSKTSNRYTVV